MIFKGLITAAAAVSLAATPAIAASQSASALSVAPAAESVEGSELGGGSSAIVVLLAIIAVGLGIYALVDDGDDAPTSP